MKRLLIVCEYRRCRNTYGVTFFSELQNKRPFIFRRNEVHIKCQRLGRHISWPQGENAVFFYCFLFANIASVST